MLVKTIGYGTWTNLYESPTTGVSFSVAGTPTKQWETTLTRPGKIKVSAKNYRKQSNGGKLYFKVNGETIYSYEDTSAGNIEPFEYISPMLNENDVFSIWVGSYATNYTSYFTNPTYVDLSYILTSPFVKGYPQKIDSLGEFSTITLYGNHPLDNVFKGGIMLEKSNSANSGEITLPNAVGYIKVFFNGEYIKIPYYGD